MKKTLECNIINEYPVFGNIRKTNSYENSTWISSGLRPQCSNGTPAARLIRLISLDIHTQAVNWYKMIHKNLTVTKHLWSGNALIPGEVFISLHHRAIYKYWGRERLYFFLLINRVKNPKYNGCLQSYFIIITELTIPNIKVYNSPILLFLFVYYFYNWCCVLGIGLEFNQP